MALQKKQTIIVYNFHLNQKRMKKKNLIWTLGILIGMALGFTACTNDDEGGGIAGDANELIIGTWELYDAYGYKMTDGERQEVNDFVLGGLLTFNADGTGEMHREDAPEEAEYFDWSISGNTIVTTGGQDFTYTIETLNDNELVVSRTETYDDDDSYYERLTLHRSGSGSGNEDDGKEDEEPVAGDAATLILGTWDTYRNYCYRVVYDSQEEVYDHTDAGNCIFYPDGTGEESCMRDKEFTWKLSEDNTLSLTYTDELYDTGTETDNYTFEKLTETDMTIIRTYQDEDGYTCYDIYMMRKTSAYSPIPDVSSSTVGNVFTGKIVKELDGRKFIYDSDGYLEQIKGDDETATFIYALFINDMPTAVDVNIEESNGRQTTIEAKLNGQGFATEISQTDTESDGSSRTYEMTCGYDTEGHLISMEDSRENRKYTLTWQDGNIAQIVTECFHDDNTTEWERTHNFSYEGADNENDLLFYYDVYQIDFNSTEYLYWAGILGTAPHKLATSLNGTMHNYDRDSESEENYDYEWTASSLTVNGSTSRYEHTFSFYE